MAVTITPTISLAHGQRGNAAFTASGLTGTGTPRWEITAGTLPQGLQFVPPGGVAGVPVAPGSSTISVRVTDLNLSSPNAFGPVETPVAYAETQVTITIT